MKYSKIGTRGASSAFAFVLASITFVILFSIGFSFVMGGEVNFGGFWVDYASGMSDLFRQADLRGVLQIIGFVAVFLLLLAIAVVDKVKRDKGK